MGAPPLNLFIARELTAEDREVIAYIGEVLRDSYVHPHQPQPEIPAGLNQFEQLAWAYENFIKYPEPFLIEYFCGKCLYELMYTEEEVAAKIKELEATVIPAGIYLAPDLFTPSMDQVLDKIEKP